MVFGKRPSAQSCVKFGYMPQDVALHPEISIRETLEYYGRLYGLNSSTIKRQWKRIMNLLMLPLDFILVQDCR